MCVRLSNTRGRLNAALGIQQKIPLSFHPATWFNITEVWESARGPRVAHVWACTGHRGPGRQRETERQRVSGWDRNLSKMTADWRRAGDPADTLVVFWCYVSPAPSCSQPSININQNDIWRQEFSSSCSFFFIFIYFLSNSNKAKRVLPPCSSWIAVIKSVLVHLTGVMSWLTSVNATQLMMRRTPAKLPFNHLISFFASPHFRIRSSSQVPLKASFFTRRFGESGDESDVVKRYDFKNVTEPTPNDLHHLKMKHKRFVPDSQIWQFSCCFCVTFLHIVSPSLFCFIGTLEFSKN